MRPSHRSQVPALKALVVALTAAFPISNFANPLPQDASVVNGQATFSVSGKTLTVTNTPGAVIEWQRFNIGAGELTHFQQQSAASQVLNRITGQDPSQILGTLSSNGHVFLINPNGIAFGPNARVDVAGLVASSLNLSNADFLAGRLAFSSSLETPGSVRNEGLLRSASGGFIYLIAPSVENHGVIQSDNGAVVLAAGKSATLVDSFRPDVGVQLTAPEGQALNVGQIVGGHIGIYAAAIRQEGTISATTAITGADGTVVFRASSTIATGAESVTEARGARGGEVRMEAAAVSHAGALMAGDTQGGRISIQTDVLTQSGSIRADGNGGAGGSITLASSGNIVQTTTAVTSARGTSGGAIVLQAGSYGQVFSSGQVDVSASAGAGGDARILGGQIVLAGAGIRASGPTGGGTVRIGGDAGGANAAIPNARSVYANQSTTVEADALQTGHGGTIVFWSDGGTRVGASLSARGGSASGDGGFIEVSGKESTAFGGTATAAAPHGSAGTFLLDPKVLIVDDVQGAIAYRDLIDPNPNTDSGLGNGFGTVRELRSGNTLVTDPYDNAMGARSGAIYLFRGTDGALLTTLTGAAANDQVGTGQRVNIGSNLLLVHSLFGSGNGLQANAPGAVTWINPATGTLSDGSSSGIVSPANSILGGSAGDRIGYSQNSFFQSPVFAAGTGYLILSENWNAKRGAITWIDSATGKLSDGSTGGVISATNSIVGASADDRVGYQNADTFVQLVPGTGNARFLVSQHWNGDRGAITWFNGATGKLSTGASGGVVDASNSIVGVNAGDLVGVGEYVYSPFFTYKPVVRPVGTGFLFFSTYFGSGGNLTNGKGAVTWINPATGLLADGSTGGAIGAANSIVGLSAGDRVGATASGSANFLSFGSNAVILSPDFGGGQGAITWINGNTGALSQGQTGGIVDATNSFLGSTSADHVGGGGNQTTNVGYVFLSPDWNNGRGALTWIDMAAGTAANGAKSGFVGAANSIVGGTDGDRIVDRFRRLQSNHFVIIAPDWDDVDNDVTDAGAVAWVSNTGALVNGDKAGTLTSASALVGGGFGDHVGSGGVLEPAFNVTNRPYLVLSPLWGSNGGAQGKGAVTWVNGVTGATLAGTGAGVIDAANSLVGTLVGDRVGVNDIDDSLGGSGAVQVAFGRNFIISSPYWNGARGAVTWIDSATGNTSAGTAAIGAVGNANSLTGSSPNDRIGEFIHRLSSGHVLVRSPNAGFIQFDGPPLAGAVTWMDGNTGLLSGMTSVSQFGITGNGVTSVVSFRNSLVGASPGDAVGSGGIYDNGATLLILSPNAHFETGTGAVTWMDRNFGRLSNMVAGGTTFQQTSGFIGTANSLMAAGSPDIYDAVSGHVFLFNQTGAGTVTWMSNQGLLTTGATGGVRSALNSVFGSAADEGAGMALERLNGSNNYVLRTTTWSNGGTQTNAGAVTWLSSFTGRMANGANGGVISGSNSIVGAAAGDLVGSDGVVRVHNSATGYLVRSSHWNNGGNTADAGALTWFDGNTGLLVGMTSTTSFGTDAGVVSASNSLVGTRTGDLVGGDGFGIQEIGFYYSSPYRVFIRNVGVNDGGGAITWMAASTGQLSDGTFAGPISSANSLLGADAGDAIGSGGYRSVGNNDYLKYFVSSPEWNNGRGAVTWINGETGRLSDGSTGGEVSALNSVVGISGGDRVGSGGIVRVSDDYYQGQHLILSPGWGDGVGAVTWIHGTTGLLHDDATGIAVDTGNSLVGKSLDSLGSGGILSLGGSKYLLKSPGWGNGAGALTWFNGLDGTLATGALMRGEADATNSIVGKAAGDAIGSGGIQYINNTSVLIYSPEWNDGGTKARAGAVTWLDRATGRLANMTSGADYGTVGGVVDANNSVVGANAGDVAGGYFYNYYYNYEYFQSDYQYLTNDRILLVTQGYRGDMGALTWIDLTTGRLADGSAGGRIGAANSIVGDRAGDQVGNYGVETNFASGIGTVGFIRSPNWHDSTGAVTWIRADTGKLIDGSAGGLLSSSNSIVGAQSGDLVGYNSEIVENDSGEHFVFYTSTWGGGRGAFTWTRMDGTLRNMTSATGFDGTVSAANSLVGASAGDALGSSGVQRMSDSQGNDILVIRSGEWNGQRGAITRIDADGNLLTGAMAVGTINETNSFVGNHAGDRIGAYAPQFVSGGNYLIVSPTYDNNRGSVTLMNRDWNLVGTVNADNSVTGNAANAGLQVSSIFSPNIQQDSSNNTSLIRFATDGTGRITVLSNSIPVGRTPDVLFGDSNGGIVTVSPGTIASILNEGTRVVLQATSDIIVKKAITATGTTEDDGVLVLQAGRSIFINANITNNNRVGFDTTDQGLSFKAIANSTLPGNLAGQREAGPGVIQTAAGVSITTRGGVFLSAQSIGTSSVPVSINTAADATVRAITTLGNMYLRQLGGPTRLSLLDLDAPLGKLIQFDSNDQGLVIDAPVSVTNGADLHFIAGANGLEIRSNVSSSGNITLESRGVVRVADVNINSTAGSLSITGTSLEVTAGTRSTVIQGTTATKLDVKGDVVIKGSDTTSGANAQLGGAGVCSGTIGGNLVLVGGSAAGAKATLIGSPDVGSSSQPVQVLGNISFVAGSGEGAYARIEAVAPDSIFINFPNLSSGGYTVNGAPVTSSGLSGFFAGGLPAILDQNLHITYVPLTTELGLPPQATDSSIIQIVWRGQQFPWVEKRDEEQQLQLGLKSCR